MKLNDLFPSRFLKADDAADGDLIYTITGVKVEILGSGEDAEHKAILSFGETEKELVLNKTNANTIAGLYGSETDNWVGKKIALFSTEVQFRDQMVLALRVRMKAPVNHDDDGKPASEKAWDAWNKLAKEAKGYELVFDEPARDVTTGHLREMYAGLRDQVNAARPF